jgi:CNT family concentrative nucleoside transporter
MTRPSPALLALWSVTLSLLLVGAARGSDPPEDPAAPVSAGATGLSFTTAAASPAAVGAPASALQDAPGATAAQGLGGVGRRLDTSLPDRLRSLAGLILLTVAAWGLSLNRRHVHWRVVLWGLALQLLFALFILKTPAGALVFNTANDVVVALLGFTVEGARFIFGDLVFNNVPVGEGVPGTNLPLQPDPALTARTGAFFAFNVLPTIIFFSSLMTVLYHVGVMQTVVKGFAWVMQRTMRTSGAETLSAAGNIFVGQTEAPLLIKPFVASMTRSELMAVMTGGFATVAGGVMAAYVGMLVAFFPDIAGHLMAASVMSAPAALLCAKLMVPEEEEPVTAGSLDVRVERLDANVIDAAARGASEGLSLALNVGAMLLAFIALIALVNALLGWSGGLVGLEALTLEGLLGALLAPLAWIMGVPWSEAGIVGELMGLKTVLNEFVAYLRLSDVLAAGELGPRSVIIATYALSGFANFSSIAIQIGGIGGIAPARRSDLSRLGLRAMVAGSIAAFMTATVAGMLV